MNYKEQEANRQSWMKTSADSHRTDGGPSGHVKFAECQICGNLVWVCTSRDGSGHSIEPMMHGDCQHCRESLTRSPELAVWAINVAHKAAMDAVREMLASNVRDHRAGQDQPEQSTTGDVAGSGASTCWADFSKEK